MENTVVDHKSQAVICFCVAILVCWPIVSAFSGCSGAKGVSQSSRTSSDNSEQELLRDKLRSIAQAIHSFHDTNRKLPARYSKNTANQSLLSWRVHLLPYLGEQELYEQFKLHQPWDSEHNMSLLPKMPDAYSFGQSQLGKTVFVVPYGDGTMFSAPKQTCLDRKAPLSHYSFENLTDGTGRTAMLLALDPGQGIEWTRPADLPWESGNAIPTLYYSDDSTLIAMADAAVYKFFASDLREIFSAIIQYDDGSKYHPGR